MNYKLAENYGFCFGVKRAIKIAENTPNSATYGPLIHNKMEIERLKSGFNVGLVEDFDMVSGLLKLNVSIFGRNTPVEISYTQVERVV